MSTTDHARTVVIGTAVPLPCRKIDGCVKTLFLGLQNTWCGQAATRDDPLPD